MHKITYLYSTGTHPRNLFKSLVTTTVVQLLQVGQHRKFINKYQQLKMKVNGLGRSKVGQGRNTWQWAKHASLHGCILTYSRL